MNNIKLELPKPTNEEEFTHWFALQMGVSKVLFTSHFGIDQYNRIRAAWNAQQNKVLGLQSQLNNMERCYIEMKKERDELLRGASEQHLNG